MSQSLYQMVTELQGDRPWGSVLDAGTGPASMAWLQTLPCASWTAMTAAPAMAERVRAESGDQTGKGRILLGNWLDPDLLSGERFDTVLADYLLGAIDGFAPYWQDQLFSRLRPLVNGRLYVIGLEPYVIHRPQDDAGRMVWEIGRLRDACLLLAGDRPYREYPMDWTMRQLEQAGFRVVDARLVPIRYGECFITSQLAMCQRAAGKLADPGLRVAMLGHVSALSSRALALMEREGGLRHGHDYVLVAEPV